MERSFFVFSLCYLVVYVHSSVGYKKRREKKEKRKKKAVSGLGLNLEKHGRFDPGESDVNSLCIKSVWLGFM